MAVLTEPTQALGAENSKAQFVGRPLEPAGLSSPEWALLVVAVVENMQNILIASYLMLRSCMQEEFRLISLMC